MDAHASPPSDVVLLVDEFDRPLRTAGKVESHLGRGTRHRAFTLLVFDRDGRLLLTRRADAKPLWAGRWDGTVASHPRVGEGYADAARRRVPDELVVTDGAPQPFVVLNRFLYRADDDGGAENELCATVVTIVDADRIAGPREGEISELRWVAADDLAREVDSAPLDLCPWLLIALEFVARGRWTAPLGEVADTIAAWRDALDAERLAQAVSRHRVDAHYATLDDESPID